MAADTSVKVFHSGMLNTPVLGPAIGAGLPVLSACLSDGFGLVTVNSLVVASGIATASISSGHSFSAGTVALIAGATPAGLNGEKRVIASTTTTITFDAAGIADGSATGTITAKVAPLGFTKAFTGTNVAAFKSSNPASTGCYLRVDDTATVSMRVVGYESMTDVNTGIGAFPTAAQVSGGAFWPKGYSGSTSRAWMIVGDSRGFYYWAASGNTANFPAQSPLYYFGDYKAFRSASAWACVLSATTVDATAFSGLIAADMAYSDLTTGSTSMWSPRNYTGLGSAAVVNKVGALHWNNAGAISGSASGYTQSGAMAYPNPADNSLITCDVLVMQLGFAGTFPGLLHTPQNCRSVFNHMDKVAGAGSMDGRSLMASWVGSPGANTYNGVAFLDVTGPWR